MRDLIEYFKKNLKKGYTQESLHWALINQGFSKIEVDKAIKKVNEELAKSAPVLKTKPEITHHYITDDLIESAKKKSFLSKLFGNEKRPEQDSNL